MFPGFDPSKMDPKMLMELSQLVRELPPDQINRMQGIMHNMMAGFDVRKEMEEFERSLPPGFRTKLATLMASQGGMDMSSMFTGGPGMGMGGMGMGMGMGAGTGASAAPIETQASPVGAGGTNQEMNLREARLTILRAVAQGTLPPEEAEKLLFS